MMRASVKRTIVIFFIAFIIMVFMSVSGMIDIKERRPVMAGTIEKGSVVDELPGIDQKRPERMETATFALG